MDCYYDCTCGHAHHEHKWSAAVYGPREEGRCAVEGCGCACYFGHRYGGRRHPAVESGLRQPTPEMANADVHELAHVLDRVAARAWKHPRVGGAA